MMHDFKANTFKANTISQFCLRVFVYEFLPRDTPFENCIYNSNWKANCPPFTRSALRIHNGVHTASKAPDKFCIDVAKLTIFLD